MFTNNLHNMTQAEQIYDKHLKVWNFETLKQDAINAINEALNLSADKVKNLEEENKRLRDGERILCAAIWYKDGKQYQAQPKNIDSGYVLCGRRHHNVIGLRFDLTGEVTRCETSIQGFLTSLDRFVDRIEGNTIAIAAGQVFGNTDGDQLISEDLY